MAASAACFFQTSNSAGRCHQCSFRFLSYKHPPWLQHPSPKRLILQILKLHVQLELHNPSLHCYVSHSFVKFLSPSPNSWLTCCNIIFSNLSALCFRNCCPIIQQLRMYMSWICYWWFSGVNTLAFLQWKIENQLTMKRLEIRHICEMLMKASPDPSPFSISRCLHSFAWFLAWESNINPHPYFASCQERELLQIGSNNT